MSNRKITSSSVKRKLLFDLDNGKQEPELKLNKVDKDISIHDLCSNVSSAMLQFYLNDKQQNNHASASNLISGPSLIFALNALYVGSSGSTASKLKSFLSNLDSGELFSQIIELNKQLNGSGNLKTKNVLLTNNQFKLNQNYVDSVQPIFDLLPLDCKQCDQAVDQVNDLVNKTTNGKINKIMEYGNITPDTLQIIMNILYFKANWAICFDRKNTQNKYFRTTTSIQKSIPMMSLYGREFRYASSTDYQLVELDYEGKEFAMGFVLSQNRLQPSLVSDVSIIKSLQQNLSLEELQILTIPKFKCEYEYDLKPFLRSCGLESLFENCELDNMINAPHDRIYLSKAIQKTVIEVDEKGTEAAAVTMMVATLECCMMSDPIRFVADRPFTYYISHIPSSTILFIGTFDG